MKKIFLYTTLFLSTLIISSCDENGNIVSPAGLTDEEIIQGLKEALKVGTDTSVSKVSALDGYYQDAIIKILLPPEIRNEINSFKSKSIDLGLVTVTGADIYDGYSNSLLGINIPGLSAKEDDLVKGINRAAETAANTAAPIFWNAITGMTISDGKNILFGGVDTAATSYLNTNTRPALFSEYEPKIDAALNSVTVGGESVVVAYEDFVADYNAILNTNVPGFGTIGSLANMNTVQVTDLSAYSTNKGLNGLFFKVGEEEKKIRENPFHRVTQILEKVFGELDK